MNVFHLISSEGFYGAEAMLVELASQLREAGHRVTVGAFHDARGAHTEIADVARDRGLDVAIIPCKARLDGQSVREMREVLVRVDVLHTHGYKADIYGVLAADRNRTALVSTCHNWPGRRPLMRTYAIVDRLILRRFDQVAAVSDPVAHILLRAGIAEHKVSTIANGVNLARFDGARGVLRSQPEFKGRRLVGLVGRLVEGKGGAVLLRAARKVLAICPDAMFLFIGEGPERGAWETLATELKIAADVRFLGACADMPQIYASLDMLVLPSFDEGSPLCVLEAMASSVPVIATRVGGVPRLIRNGVTGLLVEPRDEDALVTGILRLTSDADLARGVGESGRSYVARHYSSGAMATRYLEVYSRALAARNAKADGKHQPCTNCVDQMRKARS